MQAANGAPSCRKLFRQGIEQSMKLGNICSPLQFLEPVQPALAHPRCLEPYGVCTFGNLGRAAAVRSLSVTETDFQINSGSVPPASCCFANELLSLSVVFGD